jgi:hypothetical protein
MNECPAPRATEFFQDTPAIILASLVQAIRGKSTYCRRAATKLGSSFSRFGEAREHALCWTEWYVQEL